LLEPVEPEIHGGAEDVGRAGDGQRAEGGEDALLAIEWFACSQLAEQVVAYEGQGARPQQRQLQPVHQQVVTVQLEQREQVEAVVDEGNEGELKSNSRQRRSRLEQDEQYRQTTDCPNSGHAGRRHGESRPSRL